MTHQGFKAIMNWLEIPDGKKLAEFLDGKNNDPTLLKWFAWWQEGDNRKIFDEIATLNQQEDDKRKNDNSKHIPIDAEINRKPNNKNIVEFIKKDKIQKFRRFAK